MTCVHLCVERFGTGGLRERVDVTATSWKPRTLRRRAAEQATKFGLKPVPGADAWEGRLKGDRRVRLSLVPCAGDGLTCRGACVTPPEVGLQEARRRALTAQEKAAVLARAGQPPKEAT